MAKPVFMRLTLSSVFLALAAPLQAAPIARGLEVGTGRLYPSLGVEARYESNFLRSPNARLPDGTRLERLSTWVTELAPTIAFSQFIDERAARAYRIEYGAKIGTVYSSSRDDYIDHRVNASLNWEGNLTHRFRFEYEFLRGHDPRGTGDPVNAERFNFGRHPDLWQTNRFEAGWTLGRPGRLNMLDLWITHYARRYTNNNQSDRDNDRIRVNATFSRLIAPKTRALLQANWQTIDYINQRASDPWLNSDELRAYAGVVWDMSRKTSFNIRGGYLAKDFKASERSNISDFGWEAEIRWRPLLENGVLDLSTKRTPQESADGIGNAVVISAVEANWVHHFRPNRLHYRLGGYYGNDDYSGSSRTDNRWHLHAGLFAQLRRRAVVGIEYQHEARESDVRLAEYNNNIVRLTLDVRL